MSILFLKKIILVDIYCKNQLLVVLFKNKINRLSELYISGIIDIDYYKQKYQKLQDELKQEENTNNEKPKDVTALKKLLKSDFEVIYNTLNNIEKRKIWRSIIDFIEIKSKNDINIKFM